MTRLTFTKINEHLTIECHKDAPFAFSVRRIVDGNEDLDAREMRINEIAARSTFERAVQREIE